jgi:hypothetical protein
MNKMKKGIIPVPQGGLGNQIFQNIAGYVISEYLNCPLYIYNNTNCNNSHSTQEYKHTIFKNLGFHINEPFSNVYHNTELLREYSFHHLNVFQGFESWKISDVKEGTILQSYYQYYPTLEPYEEKIRKVLLSGLEPHKEKILREYKEDDLNKSAFLHVRRGDYLAFSDRHYVQPLFYYKYCIGELLRQNPDIKQIYILSDDINWVRQQELFRHGIFKLYEQEEEVESLTFMSLCKAGSICANSTFSWWGAFLGSHEKRNPVFVPRKWMLTTSEIKLFPKEWNIIEENF